MGHRHLYDMSQVFESDAEQGWNHAEQPYVHTTSGGAVESGSLGHPADNLAVEGNRFAPPWSHAPRSNGYPSSMNVEMPPYQPHGPGSSSGPFLHASATGSLHVVADNYTHHASSSNHGAQGYHGVDGGLFDIAAGNPRGPYKRKSPSTPLVCERVGTSRYYDTGSSSDISMPSEIWHEKQIADSYRTHWHSPANYRGNGLSIGGEGTLRNVRSRSGLDPETNLARTPSLANPSHHSYPRPTNHSGSVELLGQSNNTPTEWNHTLLNPSTHRRAYVSDNNFISHETNRFNGVSSHPPSSVETGTYHSDFTLNRAPISQNIQGNSSQSVRGVRSSYNQRSLPSFRASQGNLRLGHTGTSDEGLQWIGENYPSRHSRHCSAIGMRSSDRNGRTRLLNDRYRSFPDGPGFPDHLTPENLIIVDRSAMYGSRSLLDQHRDMRLDIDNMSYEELLALGERIGSVSTGLSENQISRCLRESVYGPSDQSHEERKCVICLEEYETMDEIGSLKACSHDFHTGCIRKWLSLKNLCPICKTPALEDNVKE